jgi:high-affinity Fe2+/Pb2+ permease
LALALGTLNAVYVVYTAFAGPFVFLMVILGWKAPDRGVSLARCVGAFGGWVIFLGLFWFFDYGVQWLFSFRASAVIIGSALAGGFVAAGESLADTILRRARTARKNTP